MDKAADDNILEAESGLTDNEGSLLALVLRREPVTAYQLLKIYEQSPVSSFNESKGSLYPLIRRMKTRGLLAADKISGDRRGAELLSCTDAGRDAIRQWVRQVRPAHILLDDPLRTRIVSFDLLSHDERLEWLTRVRMMVTQKIEEVESFGVGLDMPFQDLAEANALHALIGRMEWLDRVADAIEE